MRYHLFLTRHGQCVHNDKAYEHLWNLNNDEIMGLTPIGISSTIQKAQYLAGFLNKDHPVVLLTSESVRSVQTASLLRTMLVEHHGFPQVDVSKPGLSLLNEFPHPKLRAKLPVDWFNSEFKSNPDHRFDPSWQTFSEQLDDLYTGLTLGEVQEKISQSTELAIPNTSTEPQVVIVGHHYKMNALLGAIFRKRLNEADSGCKEFPSLKRTSLGLKINHNQVMYIS